MLLIGFAAASYQITTKTPGLWQPTTSTSQSQGSTDDSSQTSAGSSSQGDVQSQSTGTSSGESQTGGSNVISSSAAKTAAQNAIDVKGAEAGTPKLSSDGTYYTVPVIDNGKVTGEIEVDAKTGVVTGGTA